MSDRIKQIDLELEKYFTLKEAFENIIIKLRDEREAIVSKSLVGMELTPQSYLAFRDWNSIDTATYNRFDKWITDNYFHKGVRRSGYFPKTGQAALELVFDQHKSFEEQLGLLEFWPYVEATTNPYRENDDDPQCYVGIFEYTLSKNASYSLRSNPEKTKFWVQTHHSYTDPMFESDDIKAAMKYVYNRLPYIRAKKKNKV